MSTRTFKLLTGPECEVRRPLAKHQELIIVTDKNTNVVKNHNQVLKDLIVRIGSDTNITGDKVAELFVGDRDKILFEAGLASHLYAQEITEMMDLEVKELADEKIKIQEDGSILFPFRFKHTFIYEESGVKKKDDFTLQEIFEVRFKDYKLANTECKEYSEVLEQRDFVMDLTKKFPKLFQGKAIHFQFTNGRTAKESQAMNVSGPKMSELIAMFKPRYFDKDNERYTQVNVKELETIEISLIFNFIQKKIGGIEASKTIEHPEKPHITSVVNLMINPEFFFPNTDHILDTLGES